MGLTWLAASSQPAVGPTLELASAAWTAEPAGARQEQKDEQSPIQTSHLISSLWLRQLARGAKEMSNQRLTDRHLISLAAWADQLEHNFRDGSGTTLHPPWYVCVCVSGERGRPREGRGH